MKNYMLDLQLFASTNPIHTVDPNVQTTGTSTLSVEAKEFYTKDLLRLAQANCVYVQLGGKQSIPRNGGKTVEWRQMSAFPKALTPLTEGVTPNGVPVVVAKINRTLQEFGAYSTLTDILDLTSIDPMVVEVTARHAQSMALTLDTIVKNELAKCANVLRAGDAASKGVIDDSATYKLTPQLIAKAVTFLKQRNAPKIDGSYVAVIHPSVAYDIMTSPDWIDIRKYRNSVNIFNGEIGKLYGVRFIESTEARIASDGASFTDSDGTKKHAVYDCFFLGKDAFKVIDVGGAGAEVIVKEKGSAGTNDPLNRRSTVGWKIPMFGAKVTIPDYIVRVECGSSFGKTDAQNIQ